MTLRGRAVLAGVLVDAAAAPRSTRGCGVEAALAQVPWHGARFEHCGGPAAEEA
ncbi:hypothetical protein [Sorangium sp. So ce542]|uniref:hypothetical protein n=1 Tax=Sorangium sp. So ce542 TaxID=3133316 RepID=UPI003F61FD37